MKSHIARRDFMIALTAVPTALGSLDSVMAAEATASPEPVTQAKPSSPAIVRPGQFDFVMAGAGHNSLACAAYLARAGYRVAVLEAQPLIGGGVQTAELILPGFKTDVCSSAHVGILRNPMLARNELKLGDYGYELIRPDVVVHVPFADGASITVYENDVRRTAETIARFSMEDAETFKRLYAMRTRLSGVPLVQRTQTREGTYFQRISMLTGFDACRQVWKSPHMQAASLSAGKFTGAPGSEIGTGDEAFTLLNMLGGRPMPRGGSGMLATALARVVEANHGVILTGKSVSRLLIEGSRCVGVECADGSRIRAETAVVSTLHPKQLVDMAPRNLWAQTFLDDIDVMQPEAAMFAFYFALSELPTYRGSSGDVQSAEAAIMELPDSIFALGSDQARGELTLGDLPLQVVHPGVYDKSRAPMGMCDVKIEGMMPYALREGPQHWDAIKDDVAARVLSRYLAHTINLTVEKVVGKYLASPLDIERKNPAMWRGGVHHLDRRWGVSVPYRLSIPGLYQTGASTEGGGGVSGQPGRAAASLILQDQGRTLEQVVGT